MRAAFPQPSDPFEVADAYFRNRRAMQSPALYFLDEIESLMRRTPEDRREIHQAKLEYGAVRIVQDG
jgi:hypothetical protein